MRMVGGPLLAQGVRMISTAIVLLVAAFVVKENAYAAASSIVINEVMWMGSTVSPSDEWIELRNMTDEEVNLAQWTLNNAASNPISLSGTIPPRGFFIIRRQFTSSYTTSALQLEPQQVASISLTNVNNSRGNLELRNQEQIVDIALGQPWSAGVDKGSGGPRQSMQRLDSPGDGLQTENWYTCTGQECTSADFWRDGSVSNFGTPQAANSVPVVNSSPVASLSGPTVGLVGHTLTFSADDSTDPDEDELTFSWTFGDGDAGVGAEVNHVYTSAGLYSVTVTVSDGEAEAEATRGVAVSAPVYSSAAVINESLPNPVGADTAAEFIELKNIGSEAVDLGGWQLDDAEGGSAPYTISSGTMLGAGAIKVFIRSETKIALNNTADSARLLDPAGVVKSSHSYGASVSEGQSYNRTSGGTYVISTTLTAGSENIITAPAEEEEDTDDEESLSTTSKQAKATGKVAGATAMNINIKDVREEEEGTTVMTEGVVSVPPGIFGERIMYLAGSGIQVYFHQASFPEVKLGDTVTVIGELGSSLGESRLKITSKESVKKMKAGEPPTPHIVETGLIGEDHEGWLVTIQGEVVETSGDTFYVDDGSGEVRIYIKEATHIDKPKMKQGTAVTITGVVSETSSGYRILPRFQEDVRLGRVAGLTSFPATGLRYVFSGGYGLQAGLLASSGAAVLILQSKKKREPLLWRANQNH